MVSPTLAKYVGLRAHRALLGMILFFCTISSIGKSLNGWVFDRFDRYNTAFIFMIALSTIRLLLALGLPRRQRW